MNPDNPNFRTAESWAEHYDRPKAEKEKLEAENKELRENFESVKTAEQASTVDLNLYVENYNNCERLRASDWERLTKERDELKAELEQYRDQADKLAQALERIRSGLTTQQDKVEFYTKKEAHEALAEYQKFKQGED